MNERVRKVVAMATQPGTLAKYVPKQYGRTKHYRKPTPKQIRYVELFMKTGDRWAAYHGAGYKSVHDIPRRYGRRSIHQIHNSPTVQAMLAAVLRSTLEDVGISARELVDKAMAAYDNADTVKDQIAALRLVTQIIPVIQE